VTAPNRAVVLLAQWCHTWLAATVRAGERVRDAPSIGDREVELLQFVTALHNTRLAAVAVLGEEDECIAALDRVAPRLKLVRDMISHFDQYAAGTGRKQQAARAAGKQPTWLTTTSGDGDDNVFSFVVDAKEGDELEELRVPVTDAIKAARDVFIVVADRAGYDAASTTGTLAASAFLGKNPNGEDR